MKNLIYLVLLLWGNIVMAAEDPALRKSRLFILSGQSNMVRLDPGLTFTPTLKKAFPDDDIVVIKDAKGGKPISRWYKKAVPETGDKAAGIGDLYDRLIGKVKAEIDKKQFSTITFVWMQGESDAKDGHGDQYESELRGVIGQLKQDMQRDDLYVVLGRISDFGLQHQKLKSDWEKVRNAQMHIAETEPYTTWVDTDDLNGDNDRLHYTDDGYLKFGARLAQAAIALLKK